MNDTNVLLALIGLFSTVVASVFGAMTWSQKTLVAVLKEQITGIQDEKKSLTNDNRDQAQTIAKLGVSVEKLTEQGSKTITLLEDIVYGRESSNARRRST